MSGSLRGMAVGLLGNVSPAGSKTIGGWVDDEFTSWALGSVVAELSSRSGLQPDHLDIGSLDGRVRGVMHMGGKSALSTINSLANTHLFDISSYGGRLNFIPQNLRKNNTVVAVIPESELLGSKDGIEKEARGSASEIPARLVIEYLSPDGDVDPITQTSERSYYEDSVGEEKLQSVEILTDEEATKVVNVAHKLAMQSQKGTFEFNLSRAWIRLVVGDVVMLGNNRLRITSVSIDSGKQKYKAEHDNSYSYESNAQAIVYPPAPAPEDRTITESILEIMDLPLMDDTDDTLGLYVAAERTSLFWDGVSIELSVDGGQSYFEEIGVSSDSTVGYLTASLPTHRKGVWDARSEIFVELVDKRDTFEPYSKSQALNRRGMLLVGNEVVSYTNSEETTTEGVWKLSGLVRGRKGTTPQVHNIQTRVILLDEKRYDGIDLQLFDIGREYTLKITSINAVDGNGDTVPPVIKTIVPRGNTQKEYAVAKLRARKVGSDLIVSWIGVGRLGGGWRSAYGLNFAGFKVTLNGTTHTTQDSTITIPYSSGVLTVVQMNRLIGAGIPSTINV